MKNLLFLLYRAMIQKYRRKAWETFAAEGGPPQDSSGGTIPAESGENLRYCAKMSHPADSARDLGARGGHP